METTYLIAKGILKPFLHAAALDASLLLPQMLVADVPTQLRGFRPENFATAVRAAAAGTGAVLARRARTADTGIPLSRTPE